MPLRRALLLLPLLALAPPARADRRDHEQARAALARGEIRPLAEILTEVEKRWVGQVIETELEHDDGRWVYDLRMLPPSGRIYRLKLDAATGHLLKSRGPVQARP